MQPLGHELGIPLTVSISSPSQQSSYRAYSTQSCKTEAIKNVRAVSSNFWGVPGSQTEVIEFRAPGDLQRTWYDWE